jgi:hypothetical protein
MVDRSQVAQLRSISDALTGAPFRLEIVSAIASLRSEHFTPKDLQVLLPTDVGQTVIDRNLAKLVSGRFLDRPAHGNYSGRHSPLWAFVRALEEQLVGPTTDEGEGHGNADAAQANEYNVYSVGGDDKG